MYPLIINRILLLKVAKVAIYIDVLEATVGGMPKSINNGVNKTPLLKPTDPETKPAIRAKITNLVVVLSSHITSPDTN